MDWLEAYAGEGGGRPFFPYRLLSGPAPSLHAPGQILGHVRSGRFRAAGELPPAEQPGAADPAVAVAGAPARRSRQPQCRPGRLYRHRTGSARIDGADLRHDLDDRRCRRPDPCEARRPRPRRRHHRRLHRRSWRFSGRSPGHAERPDALWGAGEGAVPLGRAGRRECRRHLLRDRRHRRHRPHDAEPRRHHCPTTASRAAAWSRKSPPWRTMAAARS